MKRRDVMRARLKLITAWCLAGAILGHLPAFAQPATEKKPDAKPSSAKAGATKRAAPSTKAATAPAVAPHASAARPAVEASPTPKPLPEEAQHVSRYDAAIASARDRALSGEDAGRIREAVRAIGGGELARGKALRDQVSDPAGRKLIDWYLYR